MLRSFSAIARELCVRASISKRELHRLGNRASSNLIGYSKLEGLIEARGIGWLYFPGFFVADGFEVGAAVALSGTGAVRVVFKLVHAAAHEDFEIRVHG